MKQSLGAKTLALPTPVWVVGTYDAEGKPNFMTAAWGGVCCSKPPCIYVSLREATYSHGNIKQHGAYTVSIPGEEYWREADYIGVASGRDTDKAKDTALTPVRSSLVDAPYVDEFPLVLECRLLQTVEIGLHTQFIGEIIDVKADPDVLTDGVPDTQKVKPLVYGTGDRLYHAIGVTVGKSHSHRKPPAP